METPKKSIQQIVNTRPCSVNLEQLNSTILAKNRTVIENKEKSKYNDKNVSSAKSANDNILEPATPQANMEFSQELKKIINERNILTTKTRKRVFEALDEIKSRSEEESRNFKREKSILEIINSEIKYVHQLEIIMNFFMKPTKEQKLLRADDFQVLFGNIGTIYNVNKELLEELNVGVDNVARAFTKIGPFLKLYSVYAYEFKNILNILQNARSLNPQFAKFVESQESRPEVQNKLSALLITPIQRVPRYKLLLTQLHRLTKPTEKDYDNLTECLEKINDAADHINKIVEDQENMQRLLELQRFLRSGEPIIVKPGRTLIKEGILVKMSTKNTPSEKLYTVLMNDIILFTKMKKDEPKVNSLKCLSIFPLSKCQVFEVLDKGCMRIKCQEEELILYHDQFSETKSWIEKIKNCVKNHLNDRKTLRKDSSSRRPVKRKDMHEYNEVGVSPGKPLKKRKLEYEPEYSRPAYLSKRRPLDRLLLGTAVSSKCQLDENCTDGGNSIKPVNSQAVEVSRTPELSKEVFVFGRSNTSDFGVKVGEFLGGVRTSIKRLLGFKK
ncbi:rho guanine nucleotide exchange factor 4 [Leptinotarsa decemlineata]|uniref:rho guanine nucleotide exchange factor 4 n=1 Tax=Leptinotarsa decemlineata TaxID=7539 RepID=UPI003D30B6E5